MPDTTSLCDAIIAKLRDGILYDAIGGWANEFSGDPERTIDETWEEVRQTIADVLRG